MPYNWMSNPPSINMLLGVWWLGNLIYPEIYDYDMAEKTQEIYKLLWGYIMTEKRFRLCLLIRR
jgi:iron complex transport system substrate-binding protein